MSVVRDAVRVLVVVVALVLATIGVLSVTRSVPVRVVLAPGLGDDPPWVGDSLFVRTMELYTGTILTPGNDVEVLLNGNATYPRMWKDIAQAKSSITVQLYYALPGKMADSMCKYLAERARAGVSVDVLLDGFGAWKLRRTKFVPTLQAAGVRVVWLRPLRWYLLDRADTRSHVRAVVIDGRIGYTGGFGLADYWFGDGVHNGDWRETNVRFTGPAVAGLQSAFIEGWAEATGILLTGPRVMPAEVFRPTGSMVAGLIHMAPGVGSTNAERFLALSISGAQKTLYITNSYFIPGADFRKLLITAVRHGVDVRVLTAGPSTDVKTTWYAGRDYYRQLLRGGVRIYEYQPAMMHAKTLVVDGIWSTIGSMNFDNRSLGFNDESNVVVLDSRFGAHMDSVFAHDLTHAKEITVADLDRQTWTMRVLEWGTEKLWRVL